MATVVWLALHHRNSKNDMLINMQRVERIEAAGHRRDIYRGGYGEVVARLRTALTGQFGKDTQVGP